MTRIRLLLVPLLLAMLALSIVACGADEMATDNADDMDDMAMSAGPEGLDTSTEKLSENGLFRVAVSSNLDPLALNEIHSWNVHVETADGEAVEGAEIAVGGGMPEHNHGFPTTPEITEELGGGDYLLEGVKFSMAGWWELKLAITAAGQADDITFNLILE